MSWIKIGKKHNHKACKSCLFAKWVSWLFLIISGLILMYTFYRAEVVFQGIRDAIYLKYYVISLTGVIFWTVVVLLKDSARISIVTVVTSLVVSIYLIEGVLNLIGVGNPESHRVQAAKELGIKYDKRTKLDVVNNLIEKGIDAVPTTHTEVLISPNSGWSSEIDSGVILPLGGISKTTTVLGNESGQYAIYQSDRYGFNNPDSEWDSAQVEWLLTGDSFTHGSAVNPGEEISGQLRSITNLPAISLGIGSNGPLIELAAISEYAKSLNPKKVLWIYYEGNDLRGDLTGERINPLLMQYLEDGFSQNLVNRQKEIDNKLREYIERSRAAMVKTRWIRLMAIRKLLDFNYNKDVETAVKDMT